MSESDQARPSESGEKVPYRMVSTSPFCGGEQPVTHPLPSGQTCLLGSDGDDFGLRYWASCSCGWSAYASPVRTDAEAHVRTHLLIAGLEEPKPRQSAHYTTSEETDRS